jgi:alpha-mannosidase
VKSARIVNLMEDGDTSPLELKDNGVTLALRPFEIATLLIEV